MSKLTLEQKVSLLAAQDFWRTQEIKEHGIPALKVTDGPNGARGEFFTDGTPAALLPCGISLAATWNTEILHSIGRTLAEETKARQAQALLAPTVCMHRSPLGGRNFESFSEDPLVTGKLSSAYIKGLQEGGVGATIKHYVGNEQETWRMTVDSIIEERPLRELYLKPFEIAIREAKPWAVMSSYNLVNGKHADMNEFTLRKVLRGEWKYDGLVMSDWGGTNSTVESIKYGCDLEMPGPSKVRGKKVMDAIRKGELTIQDIDECAARVLTWIEKCGRFDLPWTESEEKSIDTQATRDLIRQAGHEGLTLLKNENHTLPIGPEVRKIAIIGPNAKQAIAGGGGSASLKPYYLTTPYDSIKEMAGDREIVYAPGAQTDKWLPLASNICTTPSGKPGVILEFYKGDKLEGTPMFIQNRPKTDLYLWDNAPKEVLPEYSFRVKTQIIPETTGKHTFGLSSVGPAKMYINGELLIDNWDWTDAGEAMFDGSVEELALWPMEAGGVYEILIESNNEVRPASKTGPTHGYGGCRIGYVERPDKDFVAEAAAVAASADVAIVVVGLDAEWESEGYDRQTMDLPKDGSQDRLIAAVAKANPRTIVVNQSGTPITMPWVNEVPAIIQAWYQGQEAGNALADVLLGNVNPSGKLPVTFPKRLEDNPAYHNWPGQDQRVLYGEGVFIGYRHYDRLNIAPQFAFGHGISYTTFEYGSPSISGSTLSDSGKLTILVSVKNTGTVAGKEIAQLYIRDVKSRLPRPEKELAAFVKVALEPGETKTVEMTIDKYAVGYYDPSLSAWIAEEGQFVGLVAASAVDIRGSVEFEVAESFTWIA
ncbi:glycoside hydrolase superfamily [Tricharina praecox]|uniref:glycoside hydrolase superfamily n=1 Tax=Tricharina praecox TaxID=43433 RepID=UPI00221F7940|nr:glycoside hydrolase superfamily [Tricharina praecox]KAI5846858.1 glycoside hydrolase superfamily [Tricharina praecox]